jgi:hypothetical protein
MAKFKGLLDFLVKQGMDEDTAAKVISRELPPEQAANRLKEQGYTPDWYHGSTHDVTGFRGDLTNPESDWGQATYFSNTPKDVEANYASEAGPDLTSRISLLAERIADDAYEDGNKAVQKQIAEIAGKKFGSVTYDERLEAAKVIAGKKLKGDTGGITYPSALDLEKFVRVGGDNPTYLDELIPDYNAAARKDIDRSDYATDEDFEDAVTEYADELRWDDVDSPESKLIETMQSYGISTDEMPPIYLDEIGTVEDLRNLLSPMYFEDAEGNAIGAGGVVADWLKQMDYKGLLDYNVNKRFGSERKDGVPMMGMDEDTVHAIVFPNREEVIRSQYGAAFDETKKGQKGILNALVPAATVGLGSGALGMMSPEEQLFAAPIQPQEPQPSMLDSVVTGAKRGFYKANSPEGFYLGLMDALGAQGAGEAREKLAQSKYKDDEEQNQLLRLLGEIVGGSASVTPF